MESPSATLKDGFLVKKNKARHCWKTRWFVLTETRLCYFRKKDRFQRLGAVTLRGAAVSFPAEGYEKRAGVFKMSDFRGKEYLLKAPSDEERQIWTHAIGAVIRALDSTALGESSDVCRQLSMRVNLSDLFEAMQDPDAGLTLTTKTVDDVEYQDCFSGDAVVKWLLDWKFVASRTQAVSLCSDLLRLAHFQPLLALARHRREVAPERNMDMFYDSPEVHYRFSSMMRLPNQEYVFDSSGSSSSSSGEKSEGDLLRETSSAKAKVTREGFLMKRGYKRHQWKVRKIVLLSRPPTLQYYSASKDALDPLKAVCLSGCQVQSVTDKKAEDGKILIFQAENEHDKEGWVNAIAKATGQALD